MPTSWAGSFLGRVGGGLNRPDEARKAGKKGPGRFGEPTAWIGSLRTTPGGDVSTPNPERHRTEPTGTRDRIDTWMRDPPDGCR